MRAYRVCAGLLLLTPLLTAAAVRTVHSDTTGSTGAKTTRTDVRLVRRCENRAKEEHCYWMKIGSDRDSGR